MAKIDFGGVVEEVVMRDEFPLEKAREVLKDEVVAVLGYGVQGPAQSLNMRDNGINVIVGQWEGDKICWEKALQDGWESGKTLFSLEEAAERGNIVQYLVSDAAQMMTWPNVKPGLKEGDALFQVTDLSKVWVMFDAYESDLSWISKGDHVEFSIQSVSGESLESRVSYIDPFINPSTRVAKVRVELPNPDGAIKPEMFANGIIKPKISGNKKELLIPKTSVLWTGKRAVVYVKVPGREQASFLYREITLGPEAGEFYVVKEGLSEGEEIAVNGVFKIDAAAQLEGKPSMMNPKGGVTMTGHEHHGGGSNVTDHQMHEGH